MGSVALDIKELSIGYTVKSGSTVVVDGIDATLHKGELVALIGRNGAGKSTLLRTLAAYQKPLGGRVEYEGADASALSIKELSRKISVVLTDAMAMANMSVQELVALGRTPYTNFWGSLTADDREIVTRAMDIMGITPFALRRISMLSDGERQKCLIAKAIAQQTAVILLDEPTAFLDYRSKVHLMHALRNIARDENKAVIVSTHDIELALRLADKLWIVSDGRLVAGTVDALSSDGSLQAFIDDECIAYNTEEKRIEIK